MSEWLANLEAMCIKTASCARLEAEKAESEKRYKSEMQHAWLTLHAIEQRLDRTIREIRALREPWPNR